MLLTKQILVDFTGENRIDNVVIMNHQPLNYRMVHLNLMLYWQQVRRLGIKPDSGGAKVEGQGFR